ncbi:gastrula zinc finger protein XlCGF26.1-like [Cyprinus carpio]|uniref:Gastrula zinc finger protein XlCGF26.1-like n=1 Tax=Cyprinus carpio TaxID=7962 RepID=A0A9Q9WYT0_CYPCA|nr:gastrula zinc finger protein XlCGF26.1-like [Cyprinus carpio]
MKMKEERQDMNEVEEKHQDQKDHDLNGEKSVSCSIKNTEIKSPFSCSQCEKTFTCNKNLKCHMVIHTGIKASSCSQCGKTFTKKRHLKNHLVTHSSEKPFFCSQCGKSFTHKLSLKNHMLIHTGIKPFSCSQCGKSFTQKSSLKKHMVVHTGIKAFTCSQCGKSFTQKSSLKDHMLLHTGIKPFSCSQCGKSFTHKSSLKNHMFIHTGIKSFICSQCGKSFAYESNLKKHMLLHTGIKSFSCSQCGKSFTHKSSLKDHMLIHTGIKSFSCSQCGAERMRLHFPIDLGDETATKLCSCLQVVLGSSRIESKIKPIMDKAQPSDALRQPSKLDARLIGLHIWMIMIVGYQPSSDPPPKASLIVLSQRPEGSSEENVTQWCQLSLQDNVGVPLLQTGVYVPHPELSSVQSCYVERRRLQLRDKYRVTVYGSK